MLSLDNLTVDVAQFRWLGASVGLRYYTEFPWIFGPVRWLHWWWEREGKSLLLQSVLGYFPIICAVVAVFTLMVKLTEQNKAQHRGNTLCYIPQGVSALNPLIRIGPQLERAWC